MKRISILFLKAAVLCMGLGVLALCTLLLPLLWNDVAAEFPSYSYAVYAVFTAMYVAAIPYFIGIYSAWRLLAYVDRGQAFSKDSVKKLRTIALSAGIISVIYIIGMPFFYIWGERDDAPGLIVIGIILVGVPMVVSVFAALLQRLIGEAVDLKSENELTV